MKGKSKQPLLHQMLKRRGVLEQQEVGYGRRRRRGKKSWLGKVWSGVKNTASKVKNHVVKVATKIGSHVGKVVKNVHAAAVKGFHVVKKHVGKAWNLAKNVTKKVVEHGKKAL